MGGLPSTRSEFATTSEWGLVSKQLRRFEVATPDHPGPIAGVSRSVACIHGDRSSLIVSVGGSHLRATADELLARLILEARLRLDVLAADPATQVRNIVSWLEEERASGFLERSLMTATLLVAVGECEVWTWLVGPHGLGHGRRNGVVFESTDLRFPVLRRAGLVKQPAFEFPATVPRDHASSIFWVGSETGYERIRTVLGPDETVIALDRGSLPFGPWPKEPIPLRRLWSLDAGWKHGLPGRCVVLGHLGGSDLELPDGWGIREVPIGALQDAPGA